MLPEAPRALRHERRSARSPALYTVLVDGDDMNEPIADAVRGDPRRPHRALRASSRTRATTRRSTCSQSVSRLVGEIARATRSRAGNERARADGRLPRPEGPDRDRRLRARLQPGDRRGDHGPRPIERSSSSAPPSPPPPKAPTRCSPSWPPSAAPRRPGPRRRGPDDPRRGRDAAPQRHPAAPHPGVDRRARAPARRSRACAARSPRSNTRAHRADRESKVGHVIRD